MNSACNVRLCFSNDPWWCVPQKLVEFGSIVIFRQLVARNRFVYRFENYRAVTCALLRPRSRGETTTETLSPECGNYDRVFNRSLSLTLNVYLGPPVAAPPRQGCALAGKVPSLLYRSCCSRIRSLLIDNRIGGAGPCNTLLEIGSRAIFNKRPPTVEQPAYW